MDFKTEDFFNNTKLDINKVVEWIKQYPNMTHEILDFVIDKVEHFKEFEDKKEFEKMMYEHRIKELYAEYMKE